MFFLLGQKVGQIAVDYKYFGGSNVTNVLQVLSFILKQKSILNSRKNMKTPPILPLLYQTVIRKKALTIQLIYSLQ